MTRIKAPENYKLTKFKDIADPGTGINKYWHLNGNGDRTLCGIALEGVSNDGKECWAEGKDGGFITCPSCIGILQYLKNLYK